MIVHLVDNEKFLINTIDLFERIFPKRNFYLIADIENNKFNLNLEKLESSQFFLGKPNSKAFKLALKESLPMCKLLIFHNLYKLYKLIIIKNLKKGEFQVAWVFWGAEFYGLNNNIETLLPHTKKIRNKNLSILKKLQGGKLVSIKREYQWKIFVNALQNKINFVLTNIAGDVQLLNQMAKTNHNPLWFTYFFVNHLTHPLPKALPTCLKKDLLIGNSSSLSNNHLDSFLAISNLDLKDRNIYVPLNYGDLQYGRLITIEGKKRFGDRFLPLTDFLSINEFQKILERCAVIIMNHKRQQAFNTILLGLLAGCKIFLREENTIFNNLKKDGFIIFSIELDLKKPHALSNLDEASQDHNQRLVYQIYEINTVAKRIETQLSLILNNGS